MYTAGSELEPRGRRIHITDLEGQVLQEVPLESRDNRAGVAFPSPDGTKLAVYLYEDNRAKLKVLSADTGALLKVLDLLDNGFGEPLGDPLGWSGDSRRLYVLGRMRAGDTTITLAQIDVETGQVVESTPLPPGARGVLSPSKEYLAMIVPAPLADGPGQVVIRSLEDGRDQVLTALDRRTLWAGRVVWDFDSRHLLYRKTGGDRLYSFSLETEEETLLVEDMQGFDFVSVSPDGEHWALRKLASKESLIWVLENFLPESPAPSDKASNR